MGRRGPAPKDAERKQGHTQASGTTLKVIEGNPLLAKMPAPEKEWLKQQKDDWKTFWATDVAGAVAESDLPVLYRLFELRDQIQRLMKVAKAEPMTTGSTGQLTVNPAYRQADTFRAEARQLEDRFGLNPSARARLGFEGARAKKTLDDLNRLMADEEPDPRVIDVVPDAAGDN